MPLPNIPVPEFPNIPFAEGVPALARSILFPPDPNPELGEADGAGVKESPHAPNWGVFDKDGKKILDPTSVVSFSFLNEFRIADYPIEQGGFESYNKVATPYDARVVFSKGGTDADRQGFLNAIETVIASLDLVDVVTPEKTYLNANIIRYDYERTSKNGVTLLSVALFLREVRLTDSTQGSQQSTDVNVPLADTQAPSGQDPVTTGAVQPQELKTEQVSVMQHFRNMGLFKSIPLPTDTTGLGTRAIAGLIH